MTIEAEIAVVGGGFAGGALATTLARRGHDVVVLERQSQFSDRARGEWIAPWGVSEAQQLGLLDVLVGAGGHVVTSLELREQGQYPGEGIPVDLASCCPGVDGALSVRLERACHALLDAASRAGARVLRSHAVRAITAGPNPRLRATHGIDECEVRCRLIVAADGGRSIARRLAGLPYASQPRTLWGAGLLVTGVGARDDGSSVVVSTDEAMAYLIPQGGDVARLYVNLPGDGSNDAFGSDPPAGLIDLVDKALGDGCLTAARPAGRCVIHPLANGLVPEVDRPGVVLVGDAAGYTNPVAGQGLAMALRDVRLVGEALDRPGGDAPFSRYARDRDRRMSTLCSSVSLYSALVASFGPTGAARRHEARVALGSDPERTRLALAPFRGPVSVRAGRDGRRRGH